MADSKRTNALIKKACRHRDGGNNGDGGNPNGNSDGDGTGGTELSLDMIIVSHLFWPTIKEESLTLPEPVQQQFDQYSKQYEHVKGTRKLIRKPHLGSVDLVLQFGPESSLSFTVSPAHAAIIYLFQDDQIRLGLSTIGSRVGLGVSAVRSKLVFWLNMRVLHEPAKDTFQLSQAAVQGQLRPAVPVGDTPATTTSTTTHPAMMLVAEEEAQPTTSAVAAQLEESMLVWERFIVNMLGSRGGCSLEVIHTALGFLLPGYSASPSDLKALLQKLIREDKVELDGSEYAKK